MNAIQIENLHFHYKKGEPLIKNLNLSVPCGAIYGLLGQNGAGKSTIIKLLTRMIAPNAGRILWWGDESPDYNLMYQIGSTLETPTFYPHLTVEDHLKMLDIIFNKGVSRIDYMLELTGLTNVKDKRCSKLSTGMKQRLAIAMALFRDPELVILDEPTNGLDPVGIIDIRNIIQQIHNIGKTVIISSHILAEMDKVCTHIGIIKDGSLVYQDKIHLKDQDESLEKLYMQITHNL